VAEIGVAAVLFTGSASCGVLSAVTNPKAAWAINEPTPLSVVVRRVEVADATAHQVERLIGETGVADSSTWLDKTAIKKEDAEALMKAAAGDSVYAGSQTRVVAAEAWVQSLSAICSEDRKYPNLLATLGPEIGKQYAEISSQEKSLSKLRAQKAQEERALDSDKTPAGEKAQHEKEKARLDAEIDKTEAAYKPKVDALFKGLKESGSKAPAPLKDKLRIAALNLRAAVDDAKNANSAALVRYPLALPQLSSDLQKAAPRFVADVIEEKTGTRPDTNGIKPDVKLDGTDVKLTLNGVPAEKLGSLSMGDVVAGTTAKMQGYVKRIVTLTALAGETQDLLSFEADLLDAFIAGLGGDKKGATDLGSLTVQAGAPGAPAAAGAAAKSGVKLSRTYGGLGLANACKLPAKGDSGSVASAKASPAAAKTAASAKADETVASPADQKPLAETKAAATKKAEKPEKKPAEKPTPVAAAAAKKEPVATKPAAQVDKPGEAKAEVFIFSSTSPQPSKPASSEKPVTKPAPPSKPTTTQAPAKPAAPADCSVSMERDGKKICL
jgi:hypothetical protein